MIASLAFNFLGIGIFGSQLVNAALDDEERSALYWVLFSTLFVTSLIFGILDLILLSLPIR